MSLTLRGIKGSALTHAELDNNFLWLGNRGTSNLTLNGDTLTITRGDDSYYTISLSGVGTTVTGLSYTGNTLTLFQSDGSSESVVIAADSFVTGFTYNNANRLTISQNQGKQDINVFINQMSGLTINGTLNTNQIVLSGTNLTNILDNTVKKYSQTLTSPTAGRYTITHNLGTTDISVSLWLAFSNELTNAKVLNRLPNSVDVEFSVAPGEDVLVLIMGTTVNSSGVAYIYSAVTVGPNQIAYGDATGLITSNSTFVRNPISGNIGVGVTSPSAKLHINNTGTDNTVLFEDNTNPDSTPFVIDNNGNVGIGTSTPTYKLDVSGTVRTTGIAAINNPPFSSPQFALEVKAIDNSIGGLRLWSNNETASVSMAYRGISSSSLFDIQTNSGQPLTLNASGNNVGIGTSTPDSKLVIKGIDSSLSNYGLKVQDSGGTNSLVVSNLGSVGVGNTSSTNGLMVYRGLHIQNNTSSYLSIGNTNSSNTIMFGVENGNFNYQLVFGGGYLYYGDMWNGSSVYTKYNTSNGDWLFSSKSLGGGANVSVRNTDAKVTIVGYGTDSSGKALVVNNVTTGGTYTESPLLVVRNDGNVGLGTTNPTHLLDLKHTPPSSAWTSFNSIRIMTDTNITPVQLVTNSKGGASLSLGDTNSDSNNGGGISLNGTNPSIFLNGNGSSYYTSMVLKSGAYGLGAGFGETYFTNYGGFGIETYYGFGVKTSATANRNDSKYALYIDSSQYVGIGTSQAGGVSSYGRLTVQGITTDTNTFKVSRPTTGLGTVSASQGIGSYSAYTRFDGIGTTFTRCLNVGESIISSGFTLAVQEIVSDTVLYSTLNTGATFTNQSYTLQGLTSINTTNLGRVGIRTDTPNANLHVHPIGTAYEAANLLIPQDLFVVGQSTGSYLFKASIPSYNSSSLSFATYGGNIDFKLSSLANNNFNVKHTVSLNEFNVSKSDIYTNFYHGGTGPSDGIIDQSYFGGVTIATRKTTRTIISNNTGGNLPDTYEGLRIYKGSWVNTSGTTYYPLIALDGNVGLGTSTPTASLHLINTTTGHTFIAQDSNPDSTPFVIDNDGNVGIGTATPTSTLDINGTNGYNQLRLRTSFTPTGSTDTRGNVGDIAWDDNNFYWKTSTQWLRVSGQTF